MACSNNMSFANLEWGYSGAGQFQMPLLKTKFRWYFGIYNLTGDNLEALPCIRASRPKIQFREMQAEHLNETIYFPSKPDWQTIQISLYDRCITTQHPIFTWLRLQYDPQPPNGSFDTAHTNAYSFSWDSCGDACPWYPCVDPLSFKPCAALQLYDGCGNIIEAWVLEHCYPQSVDFGELDMGSSEVITADITLRYDRAFQAYPFAAHALYPNTECVACSPDECTSGSSGGGGGGGGSGGSEGSPGDSESEGGSFTFAPKVSTPDFIML